MSNSTNIGPKQWLCLQSRHIMSGFAFCQINVKDINVKDINVKDINKCQRQPEWTKLCKETQKTHSKHSITVLINTSNKTPEEEKH